jgi:hypothetical protein
MDVTRSQKCQPPCLQDGLDRVTDTTRAPVMSGPGTWARPFSRGYAKRDWSPGSQALCPLLCPHGADLRAHSATSTHTSRHRHERPGSQSWGGIPGGGRGLGHPWPIPRTELRNRRSQVRILSGASSSSLQTAHVVSPVDAVIGVWATRWATPPPFPLWGPLQTRAPPMFAGFRLRSVPRESGAHR